MSQSDLVESIEKIKALRARLARIQAVKGQFELLVRFDEETTPLWGLYQQAVSGDIRVPKMNYMDPAEQSYMWSWSNGNKKWHAWNKCKGLTRSEAASSFREGVKDLIDGIDLLIEEWRDDQDPRVPDRRSVKESEQRDEMETMREQAKIERRSRDAWMKDLLGV